MVGKTKLDTNWKKGRSGWIQLDTSVSVHYYIRSFGEWYLCFASKISCSFLYWPLLTSNHLLFREGNSGVHSLSFKKLTLEWQSSPTSAHDFLLWALSIPAKHLNSLLYFFFFLHQWQVDVSLPGIEPVLQQLLSCCTDNIGFLTYCAIISCTFNLKNIYVCIAVRHIDVFNVSLFPIHHLFSH